ncbi:MAG: hypothetical protein ACXV8M_02325, partial [Candidatus Angelobacter sp.]
CGSVHFRRNGTNECDPAHSHSRPFVYNRNVVPVGKSVCLFMVLLVLSAPLIACALPGEEMSKAEQDCCMQMSDECGSSQMSDAHTCCTKTPHMDASALKTTSKYTPAAPELVAHIVFNTAPAIAANILPRRLVLPNDSSSPPGTISILKI